MLEMTVPTGPLPIAVPFEPLIRQDGTRHQGCDESSGWIWYAARVLENAVIQLMGPQLERGMRILELGSGTGWLACRLASLGASVTATDRPGALELLCRNVYLNQERWCALPQEAKSVPHELDIEVYPLHWESTDRVPGSPWDIVVASDVLYLPEMYQPMLETVLRHECRLLLLSWEIRKPTEEEPFFAVAAAMGFVWKELPSAINPVTNGVVRVVQLEKIA